MKVKKVVCVEDEPDMINLIELLLRNKGFQVTGAIGGREGLEVIRRVKPDLVLLDLMMPDMDGAEVYHHMKDDDELKHIPVIIVTVRSRTVDKTLWRHVLKVNDYITKPFDSRTLFESISRVLKVELTY